MVDILTPEDLVQQNDTGSILLGFDETIEFIYRNNSIQLGLNETALDRE